MRRWLHECEQRGGKIDDVCGRFVASAPAWELAEYLDVDESDISYLRSDGSEPAVEPAGEPESLVPPSWNVAPTDEVWAVNARRNDSEELVRRLRRYRWGLVPSWSKSAGGSGPPSFNARAETVMDKPMFRNALERRRCIVPADAFYEWEHDLGGARGSSRRKRSMPWCFRPADDRFLAFAGLWEFWRERGSGDDSRPHLVSCTIITTDANPVVAPIHDRMPVLLPRDAWAEWLSEGPLAADLLDELFLPPPAESLVAYRVAPLVNDVRLNGPELVVPYVDEPLAAPADQDTASRLFDPADLN